MLFFFLLSGRSYIVVKYSRKRGGGEKAGRARRLVFVFVAVQQKKSKIMRPGERVSVNKPPVVLQNGNRKNGCGGRRRRKWAAR